ncbi:BNR-4 repeat-containing protein [Flavivirga eckloniae]|uniref:BNR repeat-containing family member n=1 Tax=Flavivirga eckloniae TaxID=1803846 RepID=A0A2K9PU79_9FLAO|nr:BNR-4 repeat-containing protein [Flavivirga eckloniae]AUP80613.1 hypothetical protein C1H87_18605 [Flavivirga eckloniae]
MKYYHVFMFCTLILFCACKQEKKTKELTDLAPKPLDTIITLTDDGAWCWFSDPRAIYTHGDQPGVLTGWVTADGSIEVAKINSEGAIKKQTLSQKLDKDDHANPAFVELVNGENMVFFTKHFDSYVRYHSSINNKDSLFGASVHSDPFDDKELEKFPLKRTTYANPYVLEEEAGKLFCFGRWTGFKPNFMASTDHGKTFSKAKVLITNYPFDGENRPYAKYYSDGKSKIHILFTDGHPRNEPTNSVYYAYYEKGSFWRVDGSKICTIETLPFEPKDASLVYQADAEKGKSWVFDIASDNQGNPVILYARYPDDEHHIYHYTRYDGEKWIDSRICDSGNWFPQTPENTVEPEPNYSGGMVINPLNSNIIYTSEKVNGIFEIVKYTLNDQGGIIDKKPITTNSKYDNVRPFVPRNMKEGDTEVVIWMENEKYIHYTDYKTAIKMYKK